MSKPSSTLADKLNLRFVPDQDLVEATRLLTTTTSPRRFDSKQEFISNLVEGSLLNVSVIASKALSVPQGEYLIWMTDAGHTMLVPTAERKTDGGVYENSTDGYEVQTRDLLANWNRIERILAEGNNFEEQPPNNEEQPQDEETMVEPGDEEAGQAGQFTSTIDASTVDRTPIMRAMQDHRYTVTSLAAEVGVDPPAISRILRTPKDVQGDPGGRNPSMGLASKICNTLRIDPTAAFPDIFDVNQQYQARDQPANDGSGSHSHGKGGGKWTQGNTQESFLDDSIMILEATDNYRTLCESLAVSGVPFQEFWHTVFIPQLLRTTPRTTVATFTEGLLREWSGGQAKPYDRTSYANNKPNPFAVPGSAPGFAPDPARHQANVDKMNKAILPGIQQAFKKSMGTLKQDLQQLQMKAGADPKIAPHAWKVADQFYNNVMKSGLAFKPNWAASPKGAARPYDAEYAKAAAAFQGGQGGAQPAAPAQAKPAGIPGVPQSPTLPAGGTPAQRQAAAQAAFRAQKGGPEAQAKAAQSAFDAAGGTAPALAKPPAPAADPDEDTTYAPQPGAKPATPGALPTGGTFPVPDPYGEDDLMTRGLEMQDPQSVPIKQDPRPPVGTPPAPIPIKPNSTQAERDAAWEQGRAARAKKLGVSAKPPTIRR